ncbi:MAG: UDP-N-acetylmuramate--L-alanine ligase, partial [Myxococcota bacterium]|nr:UDP-N-acetylmuramate--L-alanine ligase [Myxococcota bacterium]
MTLEVQRIHFVGIGGIGMSGLAEFLHREGRSVSGSDIKESATTRRLGELGLEVFVGHGAEQVGDAEMVVASSAIGADNPEIREARDRGIPILPRGQMLADIMQSRDGIAVAGSHGKTTTTSLIDHVLQAAGLDPTSIIGGRLMGAGSEPTGIRMGGSRFLVAEADESDGSFLRLRPRIAVVTNIDPEHVDHYGDFEELEDAFVEFINNLPASGLAVICLDHPGVRAILPRLEERTLTYGFAPEADLVAEELGSAGQGVRFGVRGADGPMGEVSLPLPGNHNILNALASVAVALELGVPFQEIARGLADFRGVERRYQTLGSQADIRVVDDYAHHPAELRATLAAARSVHAGRIVSIF